MARYRPVFCQIWNKPDFQNLKRDQKLLFLYLCTNPHTTESGIYSITIRTMANETVTQLKTVEDAVKGFPAGMVQYDWGNQIVFMVNFLHYNGRGRHDVIKKSIIADMKTTKTHLWESFKQRYPQYFEQLLTLDETCQELYSNSTSSSNRPSKDTEEKPQEESASISPLKKQWFEHYNQELKKVGWITRHRKFAYEHKRLIESNIKDGRTFDEFKTAMANFVKDDWPDRNKHIELKYVIGVVRGIDNFDKWLSVGTKKEFDDPLTTTKRR